VAFAEADVRVMHIPIVAPGARRLRHSLFRGAVAVAVSAGALIVLIALRA
jgi:hypothetical protein